MARKRNAPRMEEVTDLQSEPTKATGLDMPSGLIFVTFAALLTGICLGQWALSKYFDAGMFGG
jgi:hypothetical protein